MSEPHPAVDPSPRGELVLGEGPPEWAYSRERDLDRFAPLVASADALVTALASAYVVEVTEVVPERAFRGQRLTPAVGAPLTVGVTDLPGVVLLAGRWFHQLMPSCGCDACDERAAELILEMHELVGVVVGGGLAEDWDADGHGWSMPGRSSRTTAGQAGREQGSVAWPAWPRREPPWQR